MVNARRTIFAITLGLSTVTAGYALQISSPAPEALQPPATPQVEAAPSNATATVPLFDLRERDIKFHVEDLMRLLRDHKHEGWVLTAYPDPKTSSPLIGAGFSLDLPAREHPQTDPLNSRRFLEPSSAQLWQAAGLQPDKLQSILDRFHSNFSAWGKKGFRRRIRANMLTPDVTEAEALQLLRISAIQAIYNARAYCRAFDALTAPQQMAMSQLVFQMGVNLEEFTQFLDAMNGGDRLSPGVGTASVAQQIDDWTDVQSKLIESQWARRYSTRAAAVIAMFAPDYAANPTTAERRIALVLRPPRKHHQRRKVAVRLIDRERRDGSPHRKSTATARRKLG